MVLFSSNFTFPVCKREAESDKATNKNARGSVLACNINCRIILVEVVEVPALEDTDEYEAEEEL